MCGFVLRFQPLDRFLVADGNAAVTGAFAALAEYFTSKQVAQNDCGLNLGWTAPSARLNAHSINNTKICAYHFLRLISRAFCNFFLSALRPLRLWRASPRSLRRHRCGVWWCAQDSCRNLCVPAAQFCAPLHIGVSPTCARRLRAAGPPKPRGFFLTPSIPYEKLNSLGVLATC